MSYCKNFVSLIAVNCHFLEASVNNSGFLFATYAYGFTLYAQHYDRIKGTLTRIVLIKFLRNLLKCAYNLSYAVHSKLMLCFETIIPLVLYVCANSSYM